MATGENVLAEFKRFVDNLTNLLRYIDHLRELNRMCTRELVNLRSKIARLYQLARENNITEMAKILIPSLFDADKEVPPVLKEVKSMAGYTTDIYVIQFLGKNIAVAVEHDLGYPTYVITSEEDVKLIIDPEDQEKVIKVLKEHRCVGFES